MSLLLIAYVKRGLLRGPEKTSLRGRRVSLRTRCPADVTRYGEKNYRPYFSARWSNRDAGRPVNHATSGHLRRFVTRNFILIRGTLFALDSLIKYSRDPLLSLGLTGAEQVANSSSAFPSFDLDPPSNVGIFLRGPWTPRTEKRNRPRGEEWSESRRSRGIRGGFAKERGISNVTRRNGTEGPSQLQFYTLHVRPFGCRRSSPLERPLVPL